jgi:CRP/FNR family transcriptional regulator, cyclic AMP receptor protein
MQPELEKQLIDFFSQFPLLSYKKKEIIYRQDEVIDQVAFVKSGFVRLYNVTADGKEVTINLFKPVFPITFIESAEKTPFEYCMEAVSDVQLWKCSRIKFDDFLVKNPEISLYMNTNLAKICKELINNVSSVLSGKSNQKIAGIIHSLGKTNGVQEKGVTKINLETTHSLLASMTGLTRETVSIQLKKLENEGLVSVEKSFLSIPDLNKLYL